VKTEDFDYNLPEELIAQHPSERRGDSRLLVFDRDKDCITHTAFANIVNWLDENDILVFNNTKVIPARFLGRKDSGGRVELFLVREVEEGLWEVMIKASKSPSKGSTLRLEGDIDAFLEDKLDGTWIARLTVEGELKSAMEKWGRMPLPPYIKRDAAGEDILRYQTVYAEKKGAVAAPTAGLHFTNEILKQITEKGVASAMLTLHVGPGTFKPVRVDNIKDHTMHREYFEIDEPAASLINQKRSCGGRIVAVGTTSVRSLESSCQNGKVLPNKGWTDIFIHPGYTFNAVDMMITNFHLPKSTLFMLVSAFAGAERLKEVYQEAIKERYSFFSYGDAMLIL